MCGVVPTGADRATLAQDQETAMLQAGDTEIREVEIEYETVDGLQCEYEYEAKPLGEETGEIETRTADGRKEKRTDDATLAEVKRLIEAIGFHPDLGRDEVIDRACHVLALDRSRLRKLEVAVEFENGREIEAKLH
jgi:hypothetical protein